MKIGIPKIEEWKRVNEIAKQVHEMHVKWRPDIFKSVEEVIEKERYEDLIKNKEIYVIRQENIVIGYVIFNIIERNVHGMCNRKIMKVDAICIDKGFRKKGAGTKLMKYIIKLGNEEKCTDLYLSVNEENLEAIKLYEKLGMRVKQISYSMKIGGEI